MIPKATISIFINGVQRTVQKRWGLSEIILSNTGDGEISLYQSVNQGQMFLSRTDLVAGFHGEEPAGCWGCWIFARGLPELFDNVAVSFYR